MSGGFNVRVYGIYIHQDKYILLSDEKYGEFYFTKFPGGGLEFGEGTVDGLIREFKEELNWDIEVLQHFYTTDFFQESKFSKGNQVISIYYLVQPKHEINIPISEKVSILDATLFETEAARLLPIEELKTDVLDLPIDKHVVRLLLNSLQS
jgi:8-oxo-dGTP diphosphatase